MSPRARRLVTVAAIMWMAVIFCFSSLPGSSVPQGPPALGHFVLYTVLGALFYVAMPEDKRWWGILIAIGLASLYGVTDEFHQSFVPGRTPDVMDWLVDTAGAAAGVSGAWAALTHRRKLAARRADAQSRR